MLRWKNSIGFCYKATITIRDIFDNHAPGAVVVVVVVLVVVVLVVVVAIMVVVMVAFAELVVRDIGHHKAEERSVGELIGFGVRV